MARTIRSTHEESKTGSQAPSEVWSPAQLRAVFEHRTDEQRVEALRLAGILDESGDIADLYKSWGRKVTRTPSIDDEGDYYFSFDARAMAMVRDEQRQGFDSFVELTVEQRVQLLKRAGILDKNGQLSSVYKECLQEISPDSELED